MSVTADSGYLIENGTDHFLLEDGSGVLLIDVAKGLPNNYQFVRVGDGISTGEKIR